MTNIDRREQ